ncbi:Crp/Fnr family transcriptional regulator [Caproicibacter fermentans]|uniref:Crp/Fnr family transcriptional regulator n=1 Tax=Caproicibacter fermentans TaxID=2576756 RepID=A0A7G8T7P2_9FIRM|nr:Crp/Fnr family transcriptional regulator [Caproicibacter fermentans]QNK39633.1 Crp/Fnr family transcriptional regulator [Caproicibacter fermentans]
MLLANKLLPSRLFSNMTSEDVDLLIHCLHMWKKTYGIGEYVHHINDTYNSIGFVISGKVHMIAEDFWGNRNLIQEFGELEFYGEAHSMTKQPMFFDIVAVKKSDILFINTDRIITTCHNACHAHQQLIANLMRIMSEKKLGYMHKADFLSKRTTRGKITAFLSEQARIQGTNDFLIPYNRQYLADYLAVDRSALSRELSKMREEGILDFGNNHFILINPDGI